MTRSRHSTLLAILFAVVSSTAWAQFTKLLDFTNDSAHGANPEAGLIYDGTFLYGTTPYGGRYGSGTIFSGFGTIFKIKPDGTGYDTLFNFNGTNGSEPFCTLYLDSTYLYGTTAFGGPLGWGNFFRIKKDGTGFTDLFDFDPNYASSPKGSLLFDGTYFYGMTDQGGWYAAGSLFKIKPDGTGFDTLISFPGGYPEGSLTYDGTYLYGMTRAGGLNDKGTLFRIMPDGSNYSILVDFNGANNGTMPWSDLLFDGNYLYGMTTSGGSSSGCIPGCGTIFKVKPDGSNFLKILDFDSTDGNMPYGSLSTDGTYLYGMTLEGGNYDSGVIFRIKPDGTGFTNMFNFSGIASGADPAGTLLVLGSSVYGMTRYGGTNGSGVLFKYQYDTCAAVSFSLNADTALHVWNIVPTYAPLDTNARWYWGDGTSTVGLYPSHTYATPGMYNVCVTTFSSCGDSTLFCVADSLYKTDNAMVTLNVISGASNSIRNIAIENNVDIYPIPAHDRFTIKAARKGVYIADIYDLSGQHLLSRTFNDVCEIDTSTFPEGILQVTIRTERAILYKKAAVIR